MREINNNLFGDCINLEKVLLGDNITKIGYSAFENCQKLRTIIIPESVSEIMRDAFVGCLSLEEIEVSPNNNSYVSEEGILYSLYNGEKYGLVMYPPAKTNKTYKLDSGIYKVDSNAFTYCSYLESIETNGHDHFTSTNGVLFSGNWLIAYPAGKTDNEYTIPEGVKDIREGAFRGNINLKKVTISNDVRSIANNAFKDCINLETVNLSENVTDIYSSAFEGCKKLKNINIPSSWSTIPSSLFADCLSLENIILPEGVTSISTNAFANCLQLKNITIPSTVTSIGISPFVNCPCLSKIYVLCLNASLGLQSLYSRAPDFTIYAHTNSTAKTYADSESINFISICEDGDNNERCDICNSNVDNSVSITLTGTNVSAKNLETDCTLILASYKGNRLVNCKVVTLTKETKHSYSFDEIEGFVYDKTNVDLIKAFLWNDLNRFIPICSSASYKY